MTAGTIAYCPETNQMVVNRPNVQEIAVRYTSPEYKDPDNQELWDSWQAVIVGALNNYLTSYIYDYAVAERWGVNCINIKCLPGNLEDNMLQIEKIQHYLDGVSPYGVRMVVGITEHKWYPTYSD